MSTYEQMPYHSYPVKRAEPEQMKLIAHLFGVSAPNSSSARVLEVGTGDGGHLISLAAIYPQGTFVGIDNSESAIMRAREAAAEIGLKNITFEVVGIENYAPQAESFDYFIAHGIYSWVNDVVKDSLLKLARHCLSANGVGYISYNCLPGWHQRGLLREFMNFHTAGIDSAKLKIAQARAATVYLADSANPKDLIYRLLTTAEKDTIAGLNDWHLYHDYLEESNDPRYFLTFVEELTNADLQYLADSELFQMLPLDLPPAEQDKLTKIAGDVLRLEQYLDFFRNRMFRRSLILKKEMDVQREFKPEALYPTFLRSRLKRAENSRNFVHPNGGGMSAPSEEFEKALSVMSESYPNYIEFGKLAAEVGISTSIGKRQLAGGLLQGVISDLIEGRTSPGVCSKGAVATPRTTPLARYQASKGTPVTNTALDLIQLRKETTVVLSLLDGSRDFDTLARDLTSLNLFRVGASESEKQALIKVWLRELGEQELLCS